MTDANNFKTALKELETLIKYEGNRIENGYVKRKIALEEWIEKWIVQVEADQAIINKKNINLDFQEKMKELLTYRLIDSVSEECIIYKDNEKKFIAEIMAIRRKPKK